MYPGIGGAFVNLRRYDGIVMKFHSDLILICFFLFDANG